MGILGLWPALKAHFPSISTPLPKCTRDGVGAIAVDMNCVLRSLPLDVIGGISELDRAGFLVGNVWSQVVGFAANQFHTPPRHYFLVYDNSAHLPICRRLTHEKRMPKKAVAGAPVPLGKVVVDGRVYDAKSTPLPPGPAGLFALGKPMPSLRRVLNTPWAFSQLREFMHEALFAKARTLSTGVHVVVSKPTGELVCTCPGACTWGMTDPPIPYGEADLIIPALLRRAIRAGEVTADKPMWIFKSSDTDHVVIYSTQPRVIADQVRWVRGTRTSGREMVHMGRVWDCINTPSAQDEPLGPSRVAGLLCCGSDYVIKPREISGSGFVAGVFAAEARPFLVETADGWTASWTRFIEFLNLCGARAARPAKTLPTKADAMVLLMQCMYATIYYASTQGCPDATAFGWDSDGLNLTLPPAWAKAVGPTLENRLSVVNPLTLHDPWLDDAKFSTTRDDIAIIYHNSPGEATDIRHA